MPNIFCFFACCSGTDFEKNADTIHKERDPIVIPPKFYSSCEGPRTPPPYVSYEDYRRQRKRNHSRQLSDSWLVRPINK